LINNLFNFDFATACSGFLNPDVILAPEVVAPKIIRIFIIVMKQINSIYKSKILPEEKIFIPGHA